MASALAASLAGLAGAAPPALSPPAPFRGVAPGFWANPAMQVLMGEGIAAGGAPDPGRPVTRAEFAVLLARAEAWPPSPAPGFADVPSGAWYASEVGTVSRRGVLSGTGPATFSPAEPLTRAMAAAALARALGLGRAARALARAPLPYADAASIPAWARGAVVLVRRLGLMVGGGGAFRPSKPLTRAQAAVVLARLIGLPPWSVHAALDPGNGWLRPAPNGSQRVGQAAARSRIAPRRRAVRAGVAPPPSRGAPALRVGESAAVPAPRASASVPAPRASASVPAPRASAAAAAAGEADVARAVGAALPDGASATDAVLRVLETGGGWVGEPLAWLARNAGGMLARLYASAATWAADQGVPVARAVRDQGPSPAVRLVVDMVPSSILLPGRSATLRAWLGDAFGDVASTPSRIEATLLSGPGSLAGGRSIVFTAGAPGLTRVRVSLPGRPDLAPATVTLRTVPAPAAEAAGKGIWLTFSDWRRTPDALLISRLRAAGVTHVYIEVQRSPQGFYGRPALDDLLLRAHAAGIAVIAWVYPYLDHPRADLRAADRVIAYRAPDGSAVDGLAADIEERLQAGAVLTYAAGVRAALGRGRPFVAVTLPPAQRPAYPYATLAPYVDVWAPMDYWHVLPRPYGPTEVGRWVRDGMARIRALAGRGGIAFDPILQAFDAFANPAWDPRAAELQAASRAALASGAAGVGYYRWGTVDAAQWSVIRGTRWPSGTHRSPGRAG